MSNRLAIGTRRNTIRVDRQIWVETRRLDDWCSEISRQSILFGRTQWAEFAGGIQTLSNTRFDGVALMPITGYDRRHAVAAGSGFERYSYGVTSRCYRHTLPYSKIKCIQLVRCRFGLRKT